MLYTYVGSCTMVCSDGGIPGTDTTHAFWRCYGCQKVVGDFYDASRKCWFFGGF